MGDVRLTTIENEIAQERTRLVAYANANGDIAALELAADDIAKLRREVQRLREEISEHQCSLPDSIKEALNSSDGVYHP